MAASLVAAPEGNRLINLSTRGQVGEKDRVMTIGFVLSPGDPKPILIRGVGPGLARFGFSQLASDPKLVVYNRDQKIVAENDNWDSSLAPLFSDVGAFDLNPGSRDAALHLSLPPGLYTAQLSSPEGLGMIEVYDVSGAPKPINLSTRAEVGTGDSVMIAGLVNRQPSGTRRVLVRAVGPGLKKLGLAAVLDDPVLTLFDEAGRVIASNDNWGDSDAAGLMDASAGAGAFALDEGSRDAALILELPSGVFTCLVSGKGAATGQALVEVYDLLPPSGRAVRVSASPAVTAPGSSPAQLIFQRSGLLDTSLTVRYSVGGTALPGTDYPALAGSLVMPAGTIQASVPVTVLPLEGTGSRSVEVSVYSGEHYDAISGTATVQLYLGSGTLFLTPLRALAEASASPAFGNAVLQLTSDERFVIVDVDFTGLSGTQTLAYLRMTSASGDVFNLTRLPLGQVSDFIWAIRAGTGYSVADVVANLKAGRVFVQVDSSNYPTGELSGRFAAAAGATTFTPPVAPPALPAVTPSPVEAARFLSQASFGPHLAAIEAVISKGYSGWIDEQLTLAPSSHRTATLADFVAFPPSSTSTTPSGTNRMAAWWKTVVKSDDQLRQRMAFALSEIFVISESNGIINDRQEAMTAYYDILVDHALGDFRVLLEKVSLHPLMGVYLSSLRNAKATSATSPQPDENYAREVMQLFSIGLWELFPDGTLKLSAKGKPIPTYDQATITEMAKVFTGWGFYSTAAKPSFRGASSDYFNPMMLYPSFHDDTEKVIVGGVRLPAGQGGAADLKGALDALVQHPNTAPVISRQLIQRLVTSNPSPAYVYRVAQVFANNGAGKRGDLGAVARAILLDPEARSTTALEAIGQGKLKEPLLRVAGLFRALEVSSATGRLPFSGPDATLGQAPLRSPTVFNFFEPGYQPPGPLADAGLRGPEFQILNANTAISVPNQLYSFIYGTPSGITLNFSTLTPLAKTPTDLLARINLLLCAGRLTTADETRILNALKAVPASTSDLERVRLAVYLAVTTTAGAVQR